MAAQNKMYHAVKGKGAFCNDQPISVSGISFGLRMLWPASTVSTMSRNFHGRTKLLSWLDQFWAVRSLGGCMDAMMLASGHAELWLEAHAKAVGSGAVEADSGGSRRALRNFDGGNSIYGGNGMAFVPGLEKSVKDTSGYKPEVVSHRAEP